MKAKVIDVMGDYKLVADVDGEPTGIAAISGGELLAVPISVDAKSGKVLFIGNDNRPDGWELLIDTGCPIGISLSPCGGFLAVSTRDGCIYRFEVDSVVKSHDTAADSYSTFKHHLAAGTYFVGITVFCKAWLQNQTGPFLDAAEAAARDLSDSLKLLNVKEFLVVIEEIAGKSFGWLLPDCFSEAIRAAANNQVQLALSYNEPNTQEQLSIHSSIQSIMHVTVLTKETLSRVGVAAVTLSNRILVEMSRFVADGHLDRASQLAVDASKSGIDSELVHQLHQKVNLERTLQDSNQRYDAKDFAGALFGYRKVQRWMPENKEIRARILFAEAMVTDSGLQDRFSRLE